MYIKLEPNQINNLNAFLDRVDIKGSVHSKTRGEVLAMMEIIDAITRAIPNEKVEIKE